MVKRPKNAQQELGPKVRRLRKERGLSRQDLAKQTGLSVEAISKVELQLEIPPVGTILQLSRALCLDAGDFLSQAEKEARKQDKQESYEKRKESYAYETLAPGSASLHLKAFQIVIEPHQDHQMVDYRHEGEEFVYVLDGELEVKVGDNLHHLSPGNSLHFISSTPHMLRNPGSVKTRLIVVLYVP